MRSKESRLKALEKVRAARLQKSEDTDDELYTVINEHTRSSICEIAKLTGWSPGGVHASVRRLEKDGMIQEELEEFKRMDIRPLFRAYRFITRIFAMQ